MENAWDGTTVSESLIGSGTEDDPYLIQSGADFAYIKQHMTAEGDNFAGVYFKMIKNIDLGNHSMKIGQYPGWNADRRFFAGIFDGNNCSIINLNMTESGMGGGLFSVLTGTVKNLTVYGTVKGDNNMVGGIVGWLFNGTLENCNGYVDVISTGAGETGALVGTSENGKIINCVNYGSVIGVDSVGGIAGKASGGRIRQSGKKAGDNNGHDAPRTPKAPLSRRYGGRACHCRVSRSYGWFSNSKIL